MYVHFIGLFQVTNQYYRPITVESCDKENCFNINDYFLTIHSKFHLSHKLITATRTFLTQLKLFLIHSLHTTVTISCILCLNLTTTVKSEKTNKMQQSDVYYQLLSEHVSGIFIPIFRRTKTVCYCMWCAALVLLDVVGARTPQRSAPQPLPTTSSRTSAAHQMQ